MWRNTCFRWYLRLCCRCVLLSVSCCRYKKLIWSLNQTVEKETPPSHTHTPRQRLEHTLISLTKRHLLLSWEAPIQRQGSHPWGWSWIEERNRILDPSWLNAPGPSSRVRTLSQLRNKRPIQACSKNSLCVCVCAGGCVCVCVCVTCSVSYHFDRSDIVNPVLEGMAQCLTVLPRHTCHTHIHTHTHALQQVPATCLLFTGRNSWLI